MPHPAPANNFGLVATASYDDQFDDKHLQRQLAERGVSVEVHDLTMIVGLGGCARLLFYVSPNTGRPMTVLAVPHRYDIDRWAEDYYYFEAPKDLALAGDIDSRWAELYDRCQGLTKD